MVTKEYKLDVARRVAKGMELYLNKPNQIAISMGFVPHFEPLNRGALMKDNIIASFNKGDINKKKYSGPLFNLPENKYNTEDASFRPVNLLDLAMEDKSTFGIYTGTGIRLHKSHRNYPYIIDVLGMITLSDISSDNRENAQLLTQKVIDLSQCYPGFALQCGILDTAKDGFYIGISMSKGQSLKDVINTSVLINDVLKYCAENIGKVFGGKWSTDFFLKEQIKDIDTYWNSKDYSNSNVIIGYAKSGLSGLFYPKFSSGKGLEFLLSETEFKKLGTEQKSSEIKDVTDAEIVE